MSSAPAPTSPAPVPLYIGEGRDAAFAVFHNSGPERKDLGVLFCPPFGWEDFCSFRSRRQWAGELAAAGYPSIRLDLPGGGDSGGSPRDADRLAAWTKAVAAAAAVLRERGGCRRVAAVGLGLGGLIAVAAAADGAPIDDLVLWATPSRGRAAVRELQVFARLNATEVDPTDGLTSGPTESSAAGADGSLEVGGFLLSAETMTALRGIDLTKLTLPDAAGRRILMLERDGMEPDPALREHLEASGASVSVAPGPGYSAMMDHPQQAKPPEETFGVVAAWLAEAPPAGRLSAPSSVQASGVLEIEVEGQPVRETPFELERPFGRLSGVLCEPANGSVPEICGVLLNAGALRRIGPGRMWTDVARHWAARGVPTLRLDLEAIGDSDGPPAPYEDISKLYEIGLVDHVTAALDELESRGQPGRFAVMGLCSGAYWSFHAAMRDDRVRTAMLLNPRVLFWDDKIEETRNARRVAKVMSRTFWRRLLRREIPLSQVRVVGRAALKRVLHPRGGSEAHQQRSSQIGQALERLHESDRRVLFVFGGDEPLYGELERDGRLEQIERLPGLGLEQIPGRDHTLRPLRTQQQVTEILDRALDRELEAGR